LTVSANIKILSDGSDGDGVSMLIAEAAFPYFGVKTSNC
jgi:hypothetical protein